MIPDHLRAPARPECPRAFVLCTNYHPFASASRIASDPRISFPLTISPSASRADSANVRACSECLTRCTRSARGPEPCWNETLAFAPAAEPLALHLELLAEPMRTNLGEVCLSTLASQPHLLAAASSSASAARAFPAFTGNLMTDILRPQTSDVSDFSRTRSYEYMYEYECLLYSDA